MPPSNACTDAGRGATTLPWGSLDRACLAPGAVEEARRIWTNGVFTEYASAAAFSSLATALLEGPHARLGFWFLEWAADGLNDAERALLADRAMTTIEAYAPLWQDPACDACATPVGLAGHDAHGREALRRAVTWGIARPLAEYGIALDPRRVAAVV